MATLSTTERAPILDANDSALASAQYSVASSDDTVVSVTELFGSLYAVGESAGTATLTATRTADGAESDPLEVTVTSAGSFQIHLGTPQPK